jgi:hypothetical protein
MRGDLGVHVANGLPCLLQVGGNVAITVCGLQRPWQNGQLIEQQINGAAAFVIGLKQCLPKPCFGAGDGGDGTLLEMYALKSTFFITQQGIWLKLKTPAKWIVTPHTIRFSMHSHHLLI